MDDTINLRLIGKRLQAARKRCHMTQAEVAEKLGIHTNSYGNFERGTEKPSLVKIIQCCVLLRIQPGDLLNGCAPDLQIQKLTQIDLQKGELQELMVLLSQCPEDLIHQLYIGLKAIRKDSQDHGGKTNDE